MEKFVRSSDIFLKKGRRKFSGNGRPTDYLEAIIKKLRGQKFLDSLQL